MKIYLVGYMLLCYNRTSYDNRCIECIATVHFGIGQIIWMQTLNEKQGKTVVTITKWKQDCTQGVSPLSLKLVKRKPLWGATFPTNKRPFLQGPTLSPFLCNLSFWKTGNKHKKYAGISEAQKALVSIFCQATLFCSVERKYKSALNPRADLFCDTPSAQMSHEGPEKGELKALSSMKPLLS